MACAIRAASVAARVLRHVRAQLEDNGRRLVACDVSGDRGHWEVGDVVVVEVLKDGVCGGEGNCDVDVGGSQDDQKLLSVAVASAATKGCVETPEGRLVHPMVGDIVICALANRESTQESCGSICDVQEDLVMYCLTEGGCCGAVTSISPYMPDPMVKVKYLGHLLMAKSNEALIAPTSTNEHTDDGNYGQRGITWITDAEHSNATREGWIFASASAQMTHTYKLAEGSEELDERKDKFDGCQLAKLTMSACVDGTLPPHPPHLHHDAPAHIYARWCVTASFPPICLLVGTSMSSGKTEAGRAIVRMLKGLGHKFIAAGKLAGGAWAALLQALFRLCCTALRGCTVSSIPYSQMQRDIFQRFELVSAGQLHDIQAFRDAGADFIFDFVDAGLPSSVVPLSDFVPATARLLRRIAESGATAAVIEIGSSPFEPYNGLSVIELLRSRVHVVVAAAADAYALRGLHMAAVSMQKTSKNDGASFLADIFDCSHAPTSSSPPRSPTCGRVHHAQSSFANPLVCVGPAANTKAGRALVRQLCGDSVLAVDIHAAAGRLLLARHLRTAMCG